MNVESRKRPRDESPRSIDDVCNFASALFGEDDPMLCQTISEAARSHEIDGEVLSTMNEAEMKTIFQLNTFGKVRKLYRRVQEVFFPHEHLPSSLSLLTPPTTIVVPPSNAAPIQLQVTPVQSNLASMVQAEPTPCEAPLDPAPLPASSASPAAAMTSQLSASVAVKPESNTQKPVVIKPERLRLEPSSSAAAAAPSSYQDEPSFAAASKKARQMISSEEKKVDDQLSAEGSCVGKLHWVVNTKLHNALSTTRGWASSQMEQMRLKELVGLGMQCVPPHTTVVVLGNTGTGKSTLLNSLLNETNALPTNGMRACTAALAELSYTDEPGYIGEIEFVTEAEWEAELDGIFSELVQQDGRAILNVDSERPQFGSYCKVKAVYGDSYTKSRVRDASTGTTSYKNPFVDDLRSDLKRVKSVTKYLGRREMIRATNVDQFRRKLEWFVDSSNDESSGSPWPLVRMVRMQSSHWKSLKSGTRLVDAPGIRDSNGARDAVVKNYLKNADSIWIVSHIGRAINDKTAKTMLEDSFRRQLLMDGQMSNVCFIATQTDSLLHSEVAGLTGSLRLPPSSTLEECAAARNAFAKRRIQEDFIDGLYEMMCASGDHSRTRAQLAATYSLPVFCVSSVDYMKLAGIKKVQDGPPKVWSEVEGTEIPALTRHINQQTLARRKIIVRQQCDAVLRFCSSIISYFNDVDSEDKDGDKEKQQKEKEAVRQAFNTVAKKLERDARELVKGFDTELSSTFSTIIAPHLQSGADNAAGEVVQIVDGWGLPQSAGGMHWSTYAAHIRRQGGPFRIDMNEVMAEPLYKAVSSHWDKAVNQDLVNLLNSFKAKAVNLLSGVPASIYEEKKKIINKGKGEQQPKEEDAAAKAVKRFEALVAGASLATSASASTSTALALVPAPSPPSEDPLLARIEDIGARVKNHQLATLSIATEGARTFASKAQKDISREVPPSIKGQLTSCYAACNAERGTGSHARRKALFSSHVGTHRSTLFNQSIQPVLGGLDSLRKALVDILKHGVDKVVSENEVSYGLLWEEVKKDGRDIRQRLLGPIETALAEARNADIALRTAMGDDLSMYKIHDKDGEIEEVEVEARSRVVDEIEIDSDDMPGEPQKPAQKPARKSPTYNIASDAMDSLFNGPVRDPKHDSAVKRAAAAAATRQHPATTPTVASSDDDDDDDEKEEEEEEEECRRRVRARYEDEEDEDEDRAPNQQPQSLYEKKSKLNCLV